MNALAVKTRIRERLRRRKFELERIERAYRQTVGEQRLRSHTKMAMKHHEPTLLCLVSTYNTLCGILATLIRQRKAVRGAVAPHPISRDGLYELDVDDDIWQDVGLVDDDSVDPPPWLADEDVREGIRYLLERDRCLEEENRVARERCHLQEWLKAEWDAVVLAHTRCLEVNDHDMVYQLDLKKDELRLLSRAWEVQVQPIHPAWPMAENWGPDTRVAASDVDEESFREQLVDEDDDWESDEENREDDELLDALEDLGLLDEYRFATQTWGDEQDGQWNGGMAEDEEGMWEGGVDDMYLLSSSPVRPSMW
ncbi:hypothetical protein BU15DRAFT_80265 [Melanogaster broomeanus]|nr:hypothetical protein BU15DRAFT_80265 [Melanogaster broomeanus]